VLALGSCAAAVTAMPLISMATTVARREFRRRVARHMKSSPLPPGEREPADESYADAGIEPDDLREKHHVEQCDLADRP
jgi:hypothetical protein